MSNCIVMGSQWGDEGKGKLVDLLAAKARAVVRFQGGANAGHTIIAGNRKYVLHLLPSGVLTPGCVSVIGTGCVVDPDELAAEIDLLATQGVILTPKNLIISHQAHLVTPAHRELDKSEGSRIGTTGRGIGPAYADKARRTGLRAESLTGKLGSYVGDATQAIAEIARAGGNILYEGAQGTMLDLDHGTYPFVTSSSTTIGSAYSGGGVYLEFDWRIAVIKAYATRVGHGPFPTELTDKTGTWLQEQGREFGATTGRPRRCGWLDLHLLKRAFVISGFNYIALTKLDCLRGLESIHVATDRSGDDEPTYKVLPGWHDDIRNCRTFAALPSACREYVDFIEGELGQPVGIISTGPDRAETIVRRPVW